MEVCVALPADAVNMNRYTMTRKLALSNDPNASMLCNSEVDSHKLCIGLVMKIIDPKNDHQPHQRRHFPNQEVLQAGVEQRLGELL